MTIKFKNYTLICFLVNTLLVFGQNKEILNDVNLNLPQLESVKKLYRIGNKEEALKELLLYYRKKDNLFLKVYKEDLDFIKKKYPEEIKNTINTANQVIDKNFIFRNDWDMEKTNVAYQFKGQINWIAVPFGDEEWCYMLNRHKYWIDLGRAYYLTGNEKYAKAFVDQTTHWIDENPLEDRLKKLSWRRIEAGIRCENWIKAFEYVKNSKSVTPQFFEKFLNSLQQHGEYIDQSFSDFSKTSNWGVLEFQGLYTLSYFFSELKVASQWQKDATENLNTCIKLQVLEDGSQWEQSPMYHNEVFHCFMNVNRIAQIKNKELPETIRQKTIDMAYANVKWQKPNFHQPLLGDSDDTDLRGLLTLSAYLFNDAVLKSRGYDELDYENYFLLGKKNSIKYKTIQSKNPDFTSVYQNSSGGFYMRSSWQENAYYASFNLKKLGGGHGHDDILNFTLFANNQDYLIDGGRFTYVDNEWRELFKSNQSHNTLGVDNLPNSIYKDSWINQYEARSQGDYARISSLFDYAQAENTAYKRLKDPVSMIRRVLFIKPNVWLLIDSFSANATHTYSQYFNFPDKNVSILNKSLKTTHTKNNFVIQPVKDVEMKLSDTWWSPEYNLKKENTRADLFKKATGFTSFISILYFPEQIKLQYEKILVYNRENVLLQDDVVEAVNFRIDDKEFTLMVVHNSTSPASYFYKVNSIFVNGEVVLIERKGSENTIHIIK